MEYERTILELIERVKILEEKVDMILERQNVTREGDAGVDARGKYCDENGGGDSPCCEIDRRKADGTGKGVNVKGKNGKVFFENAGEERGANGIVGEARECVSDGGEDLGGTVGENEKTENGNAGKEKGEKIGTAQIKAYIGSVVKSALDKGDEYIDLTANQIHKALGLTRRMPTVCNAMKQCMRECDEVLRKTASGYSSTFEVRYKKDSGKNG